LCFDFFLALIFGCGGVLRARRRISSRLLSASESFMALTQPREAHLAALGSFISCFSGLDVVIQATCRFALQIDDNLSRALIGQPKLPEFLSTFKLAASALKASPEYMQHLEFISTEVSYLNSIRSVIAHKPFLQTEDGSFQFYDRHTTKNIERSLVYTCPLQQMINCIPWMTSLVSVAMTLKAIDGSYLKSDLPSREKLELPSNPALQIHRVNLLLTDPHRSSPR
jgi:hypothetical protein